MCDPNLYIYQKAQREGWVYFYYFIKRSGDRASLALFALLSMRDARIICSVKNVCLLCVWGSIRDEWFDTQSLLRSLFFHNSSLLDFEGRDEMRDSPSLHCWIRMSCNAKKINLNLLWALKANKRSRGPLSFVWCVWTASIFYSSIKLLLWTARNIIIGWHSIDKKLNTTLRWSSKFTTPNIRFHFKINKKSEKN